MNTMISLPKGICHKPDWKRTCRSEEFYSEKQLVCVLRCEVTLLVRLTHWDSLNYFSLSIFPLVIPIISAQNDISQFCVP